MKKKSENKRGLYFIIHTLRSFLNFTLASLLFYTFNFAFHIVHMKAIKSPYSIMQRECWRREIKKKFPFATLALSFDLFVEANWDWFSCLPCGWLWKSALHLILHLNCMLWGDYAEQGSWIIIRKRSSSNGEWEIDIWSWFRICSRRKLIKSRF